MLSSIHKFCSYFKTLYSNSSILFGSFPLHSFFFFFFTTKSGSIVEINDSSQREKDYRAKSGINQKYKDATIAFQAFKVSRIFRGRNAPKQSRYLQNPHRGARGQLTWHTLLGALPNGTFRHFDNKYSFVFFFMCERIILKQNLKPRDARTNSHSFGHGHVIGDP